MGGKARRTGTPTLCYEIAYFDEALVCCILCISSYLSIYLSILYIYIYFIYIYVYFFLCLFFAHFYALSTVSAAFFLFLCSVLTRLDG